MGVQTSHALWTFSVPLLLCSGDNHPLSTTLFFALFEEQNYLFAWLLLLYGCLVSFLLNQSKNIPYVEDCVNTGKKKKVGRLIVILFCGFMMMPLLNILVCVIKDILVKSYNFSYIVKPMLTTFFISLGTACVALLLCFSLMTKARIHIFFFKVPLLFPKLFWGLGVGMIALTFDMPPYIIMGLYIILMAFLVQPYILSLLHPIVHRVYHDLRGLIEMSRLKPICMIQYILWPYMKKPLFFSFLYVAAFAMGETTLFFCLSPCEGTLAIELYNALMQFDWVKARLITLIMMIFFMIYYYFLQKMKNTKKNARI